MLEGRGLVKKTCPVPNGTRVPTVSFLDLGLFCLLIPTFLRLRVYPLMWGRVE